MRSAERVLHKVLHKGFSAFVLSFAQDFFWLAPTKRLLFTFSNRGVLVSFLVAELLTFYLISNFSSLVFCGEKLA